MALAGSVQTATAPHTSKQTIGGDRRSRKCNVLQRIRISGVFHFTLNAAPKDQ